MIKIDGGYIDLKDAKVSYKYLEHEDVWVIVLKEDRFTYYASAEFHEREQAVDYVKSLQEDCYED